MQVNVKKIGKVRIRINQLNQHCLKLGSNYSE